MNGQFAPGDHSHDPVDRAIRAVLSEPVPHEALEQTINVALSWEADLATTPASRPRLSMVKWVAATCALLAIGTAVAMSVRIVFKTPFPSREGLGEGEDARALQTTSDFPPPQNRAETPSLPIDEVVPERRAPVQSAAPPASDPAETSPPKPAPSKVAAQAQRQTMAMFEMHPRVYPLAADIAPIFVTVGPEQPMKLGSIVNYVDIDRGLPDGMERLHVWDWSKSNLSRVVLAPKIRRQLALSPDGSLLLGAKGKAVNLLSGKTVGFDGFSVEKGQEISSLWFSPSGRYVAASIHLRSEKIRTQWIPPLFAMRHWWALRIVDLNAGKIVSEFETTANRDVVFTKDEKSVICAHASDEPRQDMVVQRDLNSGDVICEYPAEEKSFEPVGIAISPDGKRVAACHYYGRLFVWDVESENLVSRHQFLNDDGTPDTFFGAKLLRFSPDGALLAAASGTKLRVLETKTGAEKARQPHDPNIPQYVQLYWSPDSKQITLVTMAAIAESMSTNPSQSTAVSDTLPKVYDWPWESGPLAERIFAAP